MPEGTLTEEQRKGLGPLARLNLIFEQEAKARKESGIVGGIVPDKGSEGGQGASAGQSQVSMPRTLEELDALDDAPNKAARAERLAFARNVLGDVPLAYQNQLGKDPSKWVAEAAEIRTSFLTELLRHKGQLPK